MTGTHDRTDVAVIGGGLVGASLACALGGLGLDVTVIEKVSRDADAQPSYDDRTLALNHASCRILQGLGLWQGLAGHATPIRQIIVTEHGRRGRVELLAQESGVEAFGHVIEARAFGAAVLARLARMDNVRTLCPAAVQALEQDDEQVCLSVSGDGGERRLQCALAVAADGAGSSVRRQLGIAAREHNYGQTAVICNITPEQAHHGRAFEMLTRDGPFAVLPHQGERCGLVWSMPDEEVPATLALDDSEFMARAQRRFGRELGEFQRIGRRTSYPLRLVCCDQDVRGRTVIIGNAAHAIHPVAAQGFNLGLRDVAVLAELLAEGGDPGEAQRLQRYSDWRRPDRDQTVDWTDGMVRLFANRAPLAGAARSAGLLMHALLPPMRRRLASQAMGYRGRIPRLALGLALGDRP